ncbi:MAG: response regulator [Chloroflexi bacterium]|nr:response regulator [Chloroflexota bacterium]
MIRVLVVDDSPTAREAVCAILKSAPEIQIVGEAGDGMQGVEMAAQLKPDVITMDINMPRMNGFDATKTIMIQTPTPIVVVTSLNQKEMIREGLDVLLAGALEIVQKPSSLSDASFDRVCSELIAKVMAVSQIKFPQPNN